MSGREFQYVGGELELFAEAANWKRYWGSVVSQWIRGDVLEVGAGIAANTSLLYGPHARSWRCLEPDRQVARELARALRDARLDDRCPVTVGTLEDVPERQFDTILYIDVLEHIADDRTEISRAVARLRDGGALVVLAPAHRWLSSPFDRAIGHYRRYDAATLRALTPPGVRMARLRYLDSVGLLASGANALLLRQSSPTHGQILLWDRVMIPCSRVLDPVLGYRVGKSIVAVWERRA